MAATKRHRAYIGRLRYWVNIMRDDFSKVLTERPRRGHSMSYKDVRRKNLPSFDEDETGGTVSMRRPHGYNTKDFSDLIGPLYKFLQSRVGKRWNDVHSEICKQLKGRSTTQQHLLDHLKWAVDTKIKLGHDGKLYDERDRPFEKRAAWFSRGQFWVDPRDGALKVYARPKEWRWQRSQPGKAPTEFKLDDGGYHKLIDGVWYYTKPETVTDSYRSATTGELVYYTKNVERKRQLSSKELRAYGLVNSDPNL